MQTQTQTQTQTDNYESMRFTAFIFFTVMCVGLTLLYSSQWITEEVEHNKMRITGYIIAYIGAFAMYTESLIILLKVLILTIR